MSWRFILASACLAILCACAHYPEPFDESTYPAFSQEVLGQSDLNERSAAWAAQLQTRLKTKWKPEDGDFDAWLDREREKVIARLAGTEDGSIYPLNYSMELGTAFAREIRQREKLAGR